MTIAIPTALLAAVAKWSSPDVTRPHLQCVVIRGGEILATDGHRLVCVPLPISKGVEVAIFRDHIAAAAEVQRLTGQAKRDDNQPLIEISSSARTVTLDTGGTKLIVKSYEVNAMVFDKKNIERLIPTTRPATPPTGYRFNPRYLAAMAEIVDVTAPDSAVELTAWDGPDSQGRLLGPVCFGDDAGSRFVIMPMSGRR